MPKSVILDYKNDLSELPRLHSELGAALSQLDCKQTNRRHFQLATTEIFTNLLEHSTPKPHRIEVIVGSENEEVSVEITDNGGALNNMDNVIRDACERFAAADLPTTGMGLYLVTTLFDRYEYKPANGGRIMNRFKLVLQTNHA